MSRCCLLPMPDGYCVTLVNYAYEEADFVVRFEPLEQALGFANQITDLFFCTDSLSAIAYVNPALEQRLTATDEDPAHATIPALAPALGLGAEVIPRMMRAASRGKSLQHAFNSPDGMRQCTLVSSPLRYRGCICGAMWSVREAIHAAPEDTMALDAASYRIGAVYQHELRNPLQTVHAAVTVARLRGEGLHQDLLDVIDRSSKRMAEVLAENLAPAPGTATPPGQLSTAVSRAIADAGMQNRSHLVTFTHDTEESEPQIHYNLVAFVRVFANLFLNVAHARTDARVRISYAWDERFLTCVVDDNGPGFPPQLLADVVSAQDPRRHLGLLLVTATVETHGGTVDLANIPGSGARVALRLPLSPPIPSLVRRPPDVNGGCLRQSRTRVPLLYETVTPDLEVAALRAASSGADAITASCPTGLDKEKLHGDATTAATPAHDLVGQAPLGPGVTLRVVLTRAQDRQPFAGGRRATGDVSQQGS